MGLRCLPVHRVSVPIVSYANTQRVRGNMGHSRTLTRSPTHTPTRTAVQTGQLSLFNIRVLRNTHTPRACQAFKPSEPNGHTNARISYNARICSPYLCCGIHTRNAHICNAGADINQEGEGSTTPLHMAAQTGHLSLVELMVSLGADVDMKDISGATPLRLAQSFGHKPGWMPNSQCCGNLPHSEEFTTQ